MKIKTMKIDEIIVKINKITLHIDEIIIKIDEITIINQCNDNKNR